MERPDQDWRFKIANREALIGCALAVFNFIWWYGFALWIGLQATRRIYVCFRFSGLVFLELHRRCARDDRIGDGCH